MGEGGPLNGLSVAIVVLNSEVSYGYKTADASNLLFCVTSANVGLNMKISAGVIELFQGCFQDPQTSDLNPKVTDEKLA